MLAADVHTAATWSIVLSVLMIVAGVLAICVPLIAGRDGHRRMAFDLQRPAASRVRLGAPEERALFCGKFSSASFMARSGSTCW